MPAPVSPHARRRRGRSRGQGGFTLIEMLITLVVTLIGFSALLGLHTATVGGNGLAGRSAEAVARCTETMESLRSMSVTGMVQELTGNATTALPVDTTMSTVVGRNNVTYARRVIVEELTAVSPYLVRIRVEVSWTDDDAAAAANGVNKHVVALELVRTRQEGL